MTVPTQPTPPVSEADIPRIVSRDFAPDEAPAILDQIDRVVCPEKTRVVLACLKLSARSRQRLSSALNDAPGYYRELLAEAEIPLASRSWSRWQTMDPRKLQAAFDADMQQYLAWLRG